MSKQLALLCLTLGACGLTEPRMPSRVAISTPVFAQMNSGDSLRGARLSYEFPAKHGWTIHYAAQFLETPEAEFLDHNALTFDSVGEAVAGVRSWRQIGPLLMGLGGELGLGRSLQGDDEFVLIAAGSTVRWNPEVGRGALSFSADLHYRCTFDLVSPAVGTGIQADEMFSGFVLFIGAGWAW